MYQVCRSVLVASLFAASPLLNQFDPSFAEENASAAATMVFIGTYTGEQSEGIYVCRLDPETGVMSAPELAAKMVNPSWVTLHPNGKLLYAAGEFGPYKNGGAVTGFHISNNGKLTTINTQDPNGNGPCHLAIDPTGRTIVVSNYGSGNVSSLGIDGDGRLAPSAWKDQYPTLSKDEQPHAHYGGFDPSNRFVLVCDAGLDRIWVYRFNSGSGTLTANDPPFFATDSGTHPRHLTFSHDGKFCYTIDEKSMSVTVFQFDDAQGELLQIQSISTLPRDFDGTPGSTAELIMHPSGKFLYGSNRGPDNIVGYSVDSQTGKLTLIGHTDTQGQTARGFGIDPSGRWMIVGNQNSNSVVQFKIDANTGELAATGTTFELGSPVCFQFLAAKP